MTSTPASYFLLVCLIPIALALLKLLINFVWTPLRIQKALRAQGIPGLSYRLVVGNFSEFVALRAAARSAPIPLTAHNITPWLLPHYTAWSAKYGGFFVYWLGTTPRVSLSDPELCREVLYGKHGHYPKGKLLRPDILDVLANGLVTLEGELWSQHRRMVNPAFHVEKLKALTKTFSYLTTNMLDAWQSRLQTAKEEMEIDASEQFKTLTADIIAHGAFGSSYAEGKQVFLLQYEQQKFLQKLVSSFYIPGSRFLPTAVNRHRWRQSKQIEKILYGIIRKRLDSAEQNGGGKYGDDLLGLMLSAFKEESQGSHPSPKMTLLDVINECKTFFFAGHETTASLLTWAVLLLSMYPEWQERAREEVVGLFGRSPPDAEALNQMKVVGMILNETLRLYPPVVGILREAPGSMKLGDFTIPAGTSFMIPILPLHVDPALWGPDAHEFNPQRFANGVLKACTHPMAFMPFSAGPRNCVGQNFAMIEAKVVLCMVLQRFRFRLSPGYKHFPTSFITLQAQHGMQIILEAC